MSEADEPSPADAAECEHCTGPVIDNPMPECPHGEWCSQECFIAFHNGNYCKAVGL